MNKEKTFEFKPIPNIQYHIHNGLDSPKLDIKYQVLEVIPTHKADNGTLIIGKDTGTYKLYCMINGSWTAL